MGEWVNCWICLDGIYLRILFREAGDLITSLYLLEARRGSLHLGKPCSDHRLSRFSFVSKV